MKILFFYVRRFQLSTNETIKKAQDTFDVFISYSSKDIKFARLLKHELEVLGIKCWLDEKIIQVGDSIIGSISHGLSRSRYCIVILSHNSINSNWVQKELFIAMSDEIKNDMIRVLPIRIDDCQPPTYLADKLYLDVYMETNFEQVLSKLFRRIMLNDRQNKNGDLSKVTVISLDLDNSICNNTIDERIWRQLIPELYAKHHGISLEAAFSRVTTQYRSKWQEKLGLWRDPDFWLKELDLPERLSELIPLVEKEFYIYPDVSSALRGLKKHYRLVITSTSPRTLIDFKLGKGGIQDLFERIFSISSDFSLIAKYPESYLRICRELSISPNQLVHVGDDILFDVQIPKSLGICSFHLDRRGLSRDQYSIIDLSELERELSIARLSMK
jgi:FMN phosphatase YigB (HAD superfamily)